MNAAAKTTYFQDSRNHAEVLRSGSGRYFAIFNGKKVNKKPLRREWDCWDLLNDVMDRAA